MLFKGDGTPRFPCIRLLQGHIVFSSGNQALTDAIELKYSHSDCSILFHCLSKWEHFSYYSASAGLLSMARFPTLVHCRLVQFSWTPSPSIDSCGNCWPPARQDNTTGSRLHCPATSASPARRLSLSGWKPEKHTVDQGDRFSPGNTALRGKGPILQSPTQPSEAARLMVPFAQWVFNIWEQVAAGIAFPAEPRRDGCRFSGDGLSRGKGCGGPAIESTHARKRGNGCVIPRRRVHIRRKDSVLFQIGYGRPLSEDGRKSWPPQHG